MKAIVGIDIAGLYAPALTLLGRMKFANIEADLVHIDQPQGAYPPESFAWTPEVMEMEHEVDNRILQDAKELATRLNIKVRSTDVQIGSPAAILIEKSEEAHSDLIAIGSTHKSKYGSFFFGSVGRALAIGSKRSFCIVKSGVAPTGNVTAVFATDHSTYADNALRMLARMKPAGIEKILVVTVVTPSMLEDASPKEIEKFKNYMVKKSACAVEHLKEAGINAEHWVVEGEVADVLDYQMRAAKAELLIMGAQGHGFFERMFIGSSSLQQVVATQHNVMVLRP